MLLGVNLQTSFLTPPFGFALFYMRSVAPVKDYIDKVTGGRIAGISTTQIYRGAVSFIILQAIMIAVIVAFPWIVIAGQRTEGRSEYDRDRDPRHRYGWRRQSGWRAATASLRLKMKRAPMRGPSRLKSDREDQSVFLRCWAIMKLSKVSSDTCCQR